MCRSGTSRHPSGTPPLPLRHAGTRSSVALGLVASKPTSTSGACRVSPSTWAGFRRPCPTLGNGPNRAITTAEHERILGVEKNPEWNAFYRFCRHLCGSQTNLASLLAEDVEWNTQTIAYRRRKTGTPVVLQFGDELADLLRDHLRVQGPLFPRLVELQEKHRAKLFNRRCRLLGIKGVSLHSYRYTWAERAISCGSTEPFAQAALSHKSKAVHRTYARQAEFTLPPLDEYDRLANREKTIIPVPFATPPTTNPANATMR